MHKHCRVIILSLAIFMACVLQVGPGLLAAVDESDLAWLNDPTYEIDSPQPVVVFLENDDLRRQIDRVSLVGSMSRSARIKSVSRRLRSFVPSNAAAVEQFLNRCSTEPVRRFWIVPAFSATLDRSRILELAAQPGVQKIVPDLGIESIEPVEIRAAESVATSSSGHVAMINVPYLWSLGLTGVGRLVCSFDTGVEQAHPALAGNWRGNHAALSASWFSTIAPEATPYDKADHGTHTMGTMVGVDGADTIGVAPGAEWITAGVIDQGKSLQATFSDILGAYQWVLNPDGDPETTDDVPDVVLNSWGVPASLLGPCDNTFFAAIDNVEAAGIVCVFAAGNEGPDPSSLRNPASRATSPLNAFSVGAVDNGKIVAGFSSRGPGGCGLTAVKPEIVAPGVSIRSAAKDGGYKLMSGTSMAAPFIAGLVALCRQYNPDATVEEIKWALINSAEDLGAQGEDNAYGYGLPDASRLLDYLSDPESPHFRLAGFSISDDGVGSPGETFELNLTLTRTTGSVASVTGYIIAEDREGITVVEGSAEFYFGLSGTTAVSSQAYQIRFDSTLINGREVELALSVRDVSGRVFDSLPFTVPVGVAPIGAMADHNSGLLEFTVSDFGQFGLAPGSIYNVGGRGFRYAGSENLLYEAGIIIGRSQLQLSNSIRGEDGSFVPSDFSPATPLSEEWISQDQALHRSARMIDAFSEISIPVAINQVTSDYAPAGGEGIILIRYQLVNTSLTSLNDLYFGFLSDFDLLGSSETVTHDAALGLLIQRSDTGPMVGVVALSGLTSFRSLANGAAKTGFDRSELYTLISSPSEVVVAPAGDYLTIISGGPYSIAPGDSVEIVLALVAGADMNEVYSRAVRVRELYSSPTGIDDPVSSLPGGYLLHQNYPNPFNPATTIAFELPVGSEVTLRIFNLLGQKVTTLHSGWLGAGAHQLQWDARSDLGTEVASGVYFYRLVVGEYSHARKMVLLR